MANGTIAVSQLEILTQSGTGIITVVPPTTNTNRTLTLPDVTGTLAVQGGTGVGKVLQVLQTVKTDFFTTSSTSFVDITGFSVSITASSASSKSLISSHIHASNDTTGQETRFQLRRNSTDIFLPTAGTSRNQTLSTGNLSATNNIQNMACTFLDSPNTTSSTTYSYQLAVTGGTARLNGRGDGTSSGNTSSITVMEVAA